MKTPIMTDHARQRCLDFCISTKVPKYIIRHADLVRPSYSGRTVAWCRRYPNYLAVYRVNRNDTPVVMTVLWKAVLPYISLPEEATRGLPPTHTGGR